MSANDSSSVTDWLGALRGGELDAAQPLWERYFCSRLVCPGQDKPRASVTELTRRQESQWAVSTPRLGAAREVRHGRTLCRSPLQAVADVRDRDLVARPEPPTFHTLTVDPDPVGAAQVQHLAAILGQDAVPTRDPKRVEPGIALRMAADHDQGTIQRDVGPVEDGA